MVTELEAIQSRIMILHKQKELKEQRKANQMAKAGVEGSVESAYGTINASCHDALEDVLIMKDDLQEAKDKVRDLDKRQQIQLSQKRDLENMISATERRLQAVTQANQQLDIKNSANKQVDFQARTKQLQGEN